MKKKELNALAVAYDIVMNQIQDLLEKEISEFMRGTMPPVNTSEIESRIKLAGDLKDALWKGAGIKVEREGKIEEEDDFKKELKKII